MSSVGYVTRADRIKFVSLIMSFCALFCTNVHLCEPVLCRLQSYNHMFSSPTIFHRYPEVTLNLLRTCKGAKFGIPASLRTGAVQLYYMCSGCSLRLRSMALHWRHNEDELDFNCPKSLNIAAVNHSDRANVPIWLELTLEYAELLHRYATTSSSSASLSPSSSSSSLSMMAADMPRIIYKDSNWLLAKFGTKRYDNISYIFEDYRKVRP